jgi:hypothetical protein
MQRLMRADFLGGSENGMTPTQREQQLSQRDISILVGTRIQNFAMATEYAQDAKLRKFKTATYRVVSVIDTYFASC